MEEVEVEEEEEDDDDEEETGWRNNREQTARN